MRPWHLHFKALLVILGVQSGLGTTEVGPSLGLLPHFPLGCRGTAQMSSQHRYTDSKSISSFFSVDALGAEESKASLLWNM